MGLGISVEFEKSGPTGEYVRGWASVVSVNGIPFQDHSGDMITVDEIRKAAHRFITDARVAKTMHRGQPVGEIVESVIIDDDFAKAMGMSVTHRGWWIGMRIDDEDVRKRVRSGELRAFSIGGRGKRRKLEVAA